MQNSFQKSSKPKRLSFKKVVILQDPQKQMIRDLELIKRSAFYGADQALERKSGLAGLDDDKNGELDLIDFKRIRVENPLTQNWIGINPC